MADQNQLKECLEAFFKAESEFLKGHRRLLFEHYKRFLEERRRLYKDLIAHLSHLVEIEHYGNNTTSLA